MSKRKYICADCKKDFTVKFLPKCCPYCSSTNIITNQKKSEAHAAEIISQMQELRIEVESAWQAYAAEYVKFEALRQKAVTYARRGIISEKEIPVIRKTKLADELRAYRGGVKPPTPNPNPNYRPPAVGGDKVLQDIIAGKGLPKFDPGAEFDKDNPPSGIYVWKTR